jgi:hypothetical protein
LIIEIEYQRDIPASTSQTTLANWAWTIRFLLHKVDSALLLLDEGVLLCAGKNRITTTPTNFNENLLSAVVLVDGGSVMVAIKSTSLSAVIMLTKSIASWFANCL